MIKFTLGKVKGANFMQICNSFKMSDIGQETV